MIYNLSNLDKLPANAKFGVIGNPIDHSLSPIIYNAVFKEFNIDYQYVKIEATDDNFDTTYRTLLYEKGFIGLNITSPFKKKIDKDKPINCIANVNCDLYLTNTDGRGFIRAFHDKFGKYLFGNVVIFGASGGAGMGIVEAIKWYDNHKWHGNHSIKKITLIQHDTPVYNIAAKVNANVLSYDPMDINHALTEADIIINASNCEDLPGVIGGNKYIFDIITHETPLISKHKHDCHTCTGEWMLVHQALLNLSIWNVIPNFELDDVSDICKQIMFNALNNSDCSN